MKINRKKIFTTVLTMSVLFSSIPATTARATELTDEIPVEATVEEVTEPVIEKKWVHLGNNCHSLQGTDIKVYIDGGIIKFVGHGEIPDADYWKLYERPWHNSSFEHLIIEEGITSIGSYSFYGLSKLKHITLSTTTFIKDDTCFNGIAYKPYFRIVGSNETESTIGTIPFSSLDSIKVFAQNYTNGASFILDSSKKAKDFQESTNPTIRNVFVATNKKAPWSNLDKYANGNVATPICKLSDVNPDASYVVSAQRRFQGKDCYLAFSAFIEDYTYATSFNIVVQKELKNVMYTDDALLYTLTIPSEFRDSSRSFRLLAIGNGVVNIYDDLDFNASTITFATNEPTTAYALVYK